MTFLGVQGHSLAVFVFARKGDLPQLAALPNHLKPP